MKHLKRVLFIDRDGTLIAEPSDDKVDSLEKLTFLPGVISELGRIARSGMFELVMVTNQDGLGTPGFPEETFWPAHQSMIQTLRTEGVNFHAVHIDRSFPHDNKPTRKPGIAMLIGYLKGDYDLPNSFVIGDRVTDIQLAKNLGAKGILLGSEAQLEELKREGLEEACVLLTASWERVRWRVLGN